MSVRLFDLIQSHTEQMLKKLPHIALSLKDYEKLQVFSKAFDEQMVHVKKVYAPYEEAILAKDPNVIKEWLEFLSKEVVLPLLPESIKAKIDELTPEQWRLLEQLIFGDTEQKPAEVPVATVEQV